MEATGWSWVAVGASFVAALLWWARGTISDYKGSDPGRRFASNEVDRLLDRLKARPPKPILNPKRR